MVRYAVLYSMKIHIQSVLCWVVYSLTCCFLLPIHFCISYIFLQSRWSKMCMTGHAMLAVCAGMCLLFRFVPRSQNWRDKVVAMEAVAQTIGNEAVEELGRLPTVAEPDDRPAELECDHFSMRWSFLYSDACISFIDWYAFAPLAVQHCLWLSKVNHTSAYM